MSMERMQWLSDPEVRDLFLRFPMPLALLDQSGGVAFVNRRFEVLLDPASLEDPSLQALLREPDNRWRTVTIADPQGRPSQVSIQSLPVQDGAMLVFDGAAEPAPLQELEDLRRRVAELELLSATDPLTGTWNRGHLNRVIDSEMSRSLRLKQPLSLILLDLDHFKRINDDYGHAVGDQVLRELVEVVAAAIRAGDSLFRWGGEEFVVLVPGTGYRGAAALAEGLRARVSNHAFSVAGELTISLGVAEHLPGESAEAWFQRVDAALYAAKGEGRNRVSVDRRGNSDAWAQEAGALALHLAWQEAYECGEPTIDREHRELFDLANAAIDASVNARSAPWVLHQALDRLLAHIAAHFKDEEAILERHHYKRLQAHRRAHARLLQRAGELWAAADAGRAGLGTLVEFVANQVVARHLFTADRDFYPLFQALAPGEGGPPGAGAEGEP